MVVQSLVAGIVLGSMFTFLGLPAPVPPTLAGVMGIIGLFVGYILMKWIKKG